MDGSATSLTVTWKVQRPAVPPPEVEVAVEVTRVVPAPKKSPEGGDEATVPQLPVTVGAAKLTSLPHSPGSLSVTTSDGHPSVHS